MAVRARMSAPGMDPSGQAGDAAPVLIEETSGGVARLRLNRPRALNAVNRELHHALRAALERAAADPEVRVVVLSGEGRSFSAGGDIRAMAAGEDVGHPAVLGELIWSMPKPVIALVHGHVIGQAFELAGVCDLTIAGESALFGELEVNLGASPPIPITPAVVGLKAAKQVLMLGELNDAAWALRTGVANWVVPDAELEVQLERVLARLLELDAGVLAANKAIVNATAPYRPTTGKSSSG